MLHEQVSLGLKVSSTTIHQDTQTLTDSCQKLSHYLLLKLALAPKVTMDYALSFSGVCLFQFNYENHNIYKYYNSHRSSNQAVRHVHVDGIVNKYTKT